MVRHGLRWKATSAIEHRGVNRIRDVWRNAQPVRPSLWRVRHSIPHIPLITLSCPYTEGDLTTGFGCGSEGEPDATGGRVRDIRHSRLRNGNLSFIILVTPVLSCNFSTALHRRIALPMAAGTPPCFPSKAHHTTRVSAPQAKIYMGNNETSLEFGTTALSGIGRFSANAEDGWWKYKQLQPSARVWN